MNQTIQLVSNDVVEVSVQNLIHPVVASVPTADQKIPIFTVAGKTGAAGPAGGVAAPADLYRAGGVSGHRLVTIDTPSTLRYADRTEIDDANLPVWLTTSASDPGEPAILHAYGLVVEPSWSWPVGPLYVDTQGFLTAVLPTSGYIRRVGTALTATSVWFAPESSINLSN